MPRSSAANSPSTPAPPGSWPDLTGLSCRFEEFRAARGLILAVLVMPAAGGDPAAFRALTEDIVALVESSPEAGRAAAGRRPEARLAAAGRGARNPHAAGRRLQARARAGAHIALFPGHALRPARRRFRAGNLFAPGRGKFRLPQIRRRAAHDHRLHAANSPTRWNGGSPRPRERRITACTGSTPP